MTDTTLPPDSWRVRAAAFNHVDKPRQPKYPTTGALLLHKELFPEYIAAETARFQRFIEGIEGAGQTKEDVRAIVNAPSEGVLDHYGDWYFSFYLSKDFPLPVSRVRNGIGGDPEVLINPNKMEPKGKVALKEQYPSPDGKFVIYITSTGGVDEETIRICRVEERNEDGTGKDLPDVIENCRFASLYKIQWDRDGKGFTYMYPAPGGSKSFVVKHHIIGQEAKDDKVLFEPSEEVSETRNTLFYLADQNGNAGEYDFISSSFGIGMANAIYRKKCDAPEKERYSLLFEDGKSSLEPIAEINGKIYAITDLNVPFKDGLMDFKVSKWCEYIASGQIAPEQRDALVRNINILLGDLIKPPLAVDTLRVSGHSLANAIVAKYSRKPNPLYVFIGALESQMGANDALEIFKNRFKRIVAIDPDHPQPENWDDILPEKDQRLIKWARVHNGQLIVGYYHDLADKITIHELGNEKAPPREVPLPPHSSAVLGSMTRDDTDLPLCLSGYQFPRRMHSYSFEDNKLELLPLKGKKSGLNLEDATVRRVDAVYNGVTIPITVVLPKGVELDGTAALKLCGYGGYNEPHPPVFGLDMYHWVKAGGIYAWATLPGDGDLGRAYYEMGTGAQNRKHVYNAFIACARRLASGPPGEKYTRPERLVIQGHSNGGLLVLNSMLKERELFGAVVARAPVVDLLTFDLFTWGTYFKSAYGDPRTAKNLEPILEESPLHNIEDDVVLPPTLLHVSKNDTRVDPSAMIAYAAEVQRKTSPDSLCMIRYEEDTGHGIDKSNAAWVDNMTDNQLFLERAIGPVNQEQYKASIALMERIPQLQEIIGNEGVPWRTQEENLANNRESYVSNTESVRGLLLDRLIERYFDQYNEQLTREQVIDMLNLPPINSSQEVPGTYYGKPLNDTGDEPGLRKQIIPYLRLPPQRFRELYINRTEEERTSLLDGIMARYTERHGQQLTREKFIQILDLPPINTPQRITASCPGSKTGFERR